MMVGLNTRVTKGQSFELIWVEEDERGGQFVEWAYHQRHYYHLHVGQRPSMLGIDNKCARCTKEIPGLIALAFKLGG